MLERGQVRYTSGVSRMLFQLHIPKTGGTSLFSVLSAAVHPGLWHVATSEQQLRERASGYALLAGHFVWDALAIFPERPRVLTVLRDPVELALSAYGYWRQRAQEGVFSPETQVGADEAASRTVDDLLLDPDSQLRSSFGVMTKYLAGRKEVAAGRGLEAALQHIEECAWVGTTSTLDRDAGLLPKLFGFGPIADVPHHLANPERPQRINLSSEALDILETLTEPDRILYDRARAIADEQRRLYS